MTSNRAAQSLTSDAVPVAAPRYRRLVRQWWRWKFDEGWLAADHILIVRTRFFTERYLRLYWTDITALLFFPAARNRGLMLIAEICCLLAVPILVLFSSGPINSRAFLTTSRIVVWTLAGSLVVVYALWRFTRRRWNVEILTLTGRATVPLAITRGRSAQYVGQLRENVEAVQVLVEAPSEQPPPENDLGERAPVPSAFLVPATAVRRPIVALHAAAFLVGILTSLLSYVTAGSLWFPLYIFSAVIFYLTLPALFFLQQDPGFPFAARCATVLNMAAGIAVAPALAAGFMLTGRRALASFDAQSNDLFNILRLLCCLFGIMALWKYRLDRDVAPLPPQRTTLS